MNLGRPVGAGRDVGGYWLFSASWSAVNHGDGNRFAKSVLYKTASDSYMSLPPWGVLGSGYIFQIMFYFYVGVGRQLSWRCQ